MPNQSIDKKKDREVLTQLINKKTLGWLEEKSAPFAELMTFYKCAMMEVETKLNVLNEEFSLQYDRNPIAFIKTRLKSIKSLVDKMDRNNFPKTFQSVEENINDVAGVRVICSLPDDVYMLAEALLKQDDITLICRKDYIKNPKPNGYRSLHLIVKIPIFLARQKRYMKVEIQLRTIAMDFWASLEHQLKYKKEIKGAERLTQDLKECADVSALLDARMNEIRNQLEALK